jgi:hypothetical protein
METAKDLETDWVATRGFAMKQAPAAEAERE